MGESDLLAAEIVHLIAEHGSQPRLSAALLMMLLADDEADDPATAPTRTSAVDAA
jgi:hypothetical protein